MKKLIRRFCCFIISLLDGTNLKRQNEIIETFEDRIKQKKETIEDLDDRIDNLYNEKNQIDLQCVEYNYKLDNIKEQIDQKKQILEALIENEKRKEEIEKQSRFYKINIEEKDLEDIQKLLDFSSTLNAPDVLLKLIYKTYFEHNLNDLLGRVVGINSEASGIYKITNTLDNKQYIGQCVNFKDRWRTHVKRGLGLDKNITNKLYSAMIKDGVWNFTFEVLEKCPKEQLSSREKFYIELFQTNSYGYNMKAGG